MNVENRVLEQEKSSAAIYISSILKYLLAFEKSRCKVGLVYSITTNFQLETSSTMTLLHGKERKLGWWKTNFPFIFTMNPKLYEAKKLWHFIIQFPNIMPHPSTFFFISYQKAKTSIWFIKFIHKLKDVKKLLIIIDYI